jgi:hypothetical protein
MSTPQARELDPAQGYRLAARLFDLARLICRAADEIHNPPTGEQPCSE